MILVIDDDEDMRVLAGRLLAIHFDNAVEVLAIGPDGWEGADGWKDLPWDDCEIAIIDLMMPVVDGAVILRWLMENHPRVRRITWSAYLPVRPEAADLAHLLIPKPDVVGLAEAVASLGAVD